MEIENQILTNTNASNHHHNLSQENLSRGPSTSILSKLNVSLLSWFKSWIPDTSGRLLSEPNPKQKIAELIISELLWQMKIVKNRRIEIEKEERRAKLGGVDYSWLVTTKPKYPTISELKRIELEDLCYLLLPNECTEVIRTLNRYSLIPSMQASELPDILQSIIIKIIHDRSVVTPGDKISEKNNLISVSNLASIHNITNFSNWLGGSISNIFSHNKNDAIQILSDYTNNTEDFDYINSHYRYNADILNEIHNSSMKSNKKSYSYHLGDSNKNDFCQSSDLYEEKSNSKYKRSSSCNLQMVEIGNSATGLTKNNWNERAVV